MVYCPFVRFALVEQRADSNGRVVGGGDAEALSALAASGGRAPKWNSGNTQNTATFAYQV
jgi:hypothetical protein